RTMGFSRPSRSHHVAAASPPRAPRRPPRVRQRPRPGRLQEAAQRDTRHTQRAPSAAPRLQPRPPVDHLHDPRAVPADRRPGPAGPIIEETAGKGAPTRTFQDLLRTPHDEDLFDYYATSQLMLVDAESGSARPLGKPGIIRDVSPSPDGRFVLVRRHVRPYSY